MAASVQDAAQYALDVEEGIITSCKWIKLACRRFLDDLECGENRGLYFDVEAAQHALDFFDFTIHVKGHKAGEVIELEPWQAFIIANLFGWKWQKTGFRRFVTSYVEVARKNAKSTLCSGIGLYMTGFDGEGGAEVYSAATTRDQARIVFGAARDMAMRSPVLKRRFGVFRNNLHVEVTASKFEPLSSDANTLDGLSPHCAIVDEIHAHKTREVWDVLETAVGARTQPLMMAITTAGFNRHGICYELREYGSKVLEGVLEDDTFFAVIYTLDEGDDWLDEDKWIKANPNLGISAPIDDIRRLAKKAEAMPTARNSFLTRRMNVWVNAETAWLDMDAWRECPTSDEEVHDINQLPCYIGLDLASKKDIAAAVAVHVGVDKVYLDCAFWLPEEQLNHKRGSVGNLYDTWAKSGHLRLTEGATIDQDEIEEQLRTWLKEKDVREIPFDPWNMTQLANRLLADGAPLVEVPQTVKNLSEAMKEIEVYVIDRRIVHGNHPVMNWMASNVTARVDKNGNLFPNKNHVDSKIDGMVAFITAMSRIIQSGASAPPPKIIIL